MRLAYAVSEDLRPRHMTALAVTLGALRSEAMLDHFGITIGGSFSKRILMVTLIILSILILPYLILTAVDRRGRGGRLNPGLRGRIGLALVFLFTGLGHFIQPAAMAQMLPPWVPERVAIIYLTGGIELAAAAGLLVPGLWRTAGVCLIVFLILALPANVYAAINRVEMGGHGIGPAYLLVRAPLQLILIGWTYWFTVRQSTIEARPQGYRDGGELWL